MRALLGLAPCLLVACATAPPPAATPPPAAADRSADAPASPARAEAWRTRAPNADCQAGLAALAAGAIDRFTGLGACGRIDAEAALGSSGDEPSRFEQFGEYRVYRPEHGSVLVWFLADEIRVVQILYPKLPRPPAALLGEPEAKVASQLSPAWDQWIYARRGLTLHVARAGGEVITLFAYRPTSVDAFLATDIARVSKSEAPLEDLK